MEPVRVKILIIIINHFGFKIGLENLSLTPADEHENNCSLQSRQRQDSRFQRRGKISRGLHNLDSLAYAL